MYCLSCGAQFADDRKFCPECGTPAAQTGERTIIPGGMGMTHIMGSGSMENDFPQVSSGGTEDKVFVETRVTRAEINFSGATIFREGKAELKAGDNRIYLKVALGMVSRESMVIDFARPIRSCSISGQEIITPEMTEEEESSSPGRTKLLSSSSQAAKNARANPSKKRFIQKILLRYVVYLANFPSSLHPVFIIFPAKKD